MNYLRMLSLFLVISSCQDDTRHLIAKNKLGNLTHTTKVYQIDSLLASDSVVTTNARNAFGGTLLSVVKAIKVYDTSGKQKLNIKPFGSMDTLSYISSIRVLTEQYKTKNGIGLGSTYKDLKRYHDVNNIQSLANSFIITLKDINAVVSFDRKVLPGAVRFDMEADIKPTMIPDEAKINRIWVNFSK